MAPRKSALISIFVGIASLGMIPTAVTSGPIMESDGAILGDEYQSEFLPPDWLGLGHAGTQSGNEQIPIPAQTEFDLSTLNRSWAAMTLMVAEDSRVSAKSIDNNPGLGVFAASAESPVTINADEPIRLLPLRLDEGQSATIEELAGIHMSTFGAGLARSQSLPIRPNINTQDIEETEWSPPVEGTIPGTYDFSTLGPITVESLRSQGVSSQLLLRLFELAASK